LNGLDRPERSQQERTRREDRHHNFYAARDNLRLAQRIATIARSVSEIPEVAAKTGSNPGTDEAVDDERDDNSLGMIEKLGEGEQALNQLSETLGAMGAESEELAHLAVKATEEILESDKHNRGFAGRMAITQRYAQSLQAPAVRIQELGQKYTSELMKVHAMTTTILEIVEGDPESTHEAEKYLQEVVKLSEGAMEAVESTRGFVRSLQENAKLSRSLRPPTRQITTGLQAFVDGGAIIAEWANRARPLLAHGAAAEAIRERAGLLDPTPEQAEAFWRENEPHMLPPDDER
jgi:hypothetical protein